MKHIWINTKGTKNQGLDQNDLSDVLYCIVVAIDVFFCDVHCRSHLSGIRLNVSINKETEGGGLTFSH